jgi:putative transposase
MDRSAGDEHRRRRVLHVIRDRDSLYGHEFRRRIQSLGMKEVVTAPHSPWQNAFVERLIGSIRRECLNHVVVLSQRTFAVY